MSRVAFLLALAIAAALAGWTWFRHDSADEQAAAPGAAPKAGPASRRLLPPAPPKQDETPYTFSPATHDGIGKFFHGREIAQVMGHPAIDWLERGSREAEEAPSKAIAAIDLKRRRDRGHRRGLRLL